MQALKLGDRQRSFENARIAGKSEGVVDPLQSVAVATKTIDDIIFGLPSQNQALPQDVHVSAWRNDTFRCNR
ncbi:MAG: hypothetical protein LBE81_12820 [Azonexus sp.]|uniref:hypothetical protein n=1 Tax=Azonexus sp. TaxID=1872668 RepID=UPI00281BCBFA|nr:hypothetical protein [Azonexus sp.]MDR0777498.1 hypothetical protein [Azonexus sp.]